MVAPSVATDHFAQFPAGDSGGSGDIDYRCFFWRKRKACSVRLRERVLVFRYVGFVHACHVVVCVCSRFPSCWFAVNVHPDVPEVGCLWQFVYSKCSFFVCVLCRCFLAGLQQCRAQGDRLVDYGSSDEESSSSTPPAGCLPKAKATLGECMLDSSSSSMEEIVEEGSAGSSKA